MKTQDEVQPDFPIAPLENDIRYSVLGLNSCYIIPDEVTTNLDTLSISVHAPQSIQNIDLFIDGNLETQLSYTDTLFVAHLTLGNHSAGKHTILLTADHSDTAFYRDTFNYSNPLYITVSNDWDSPMNNPGRYDLNVVLGDSLHAHHPELIITHLLSPYSFTDTSISSLRSAWFAQWLIDKQSKFKDEVGLHIHPYKSFVSFAGVAYIADGSWRDIGIDSEGYSIPLYRYSYADFSRLLKVSDSIFLANGLLKPVTFRASAWCIQPHIMQALQDDGFIVDASGCNSKRIEEIHDWGLALYDLIATAWWNVTDTCGPYYPSTNDCASTQSPTFSLLEVPDNGVLADYITTEEMADIFYQLLGNKALTRPKMLSIGYHPDSFDSYYSRLNDALTIFDGYLATNGNGPVVYVSMSDCVKIWEKN